MSILKHFNESKNIQYYIYCLLLTFQDEMSPHTISLYFTQFPFWLNTHGLQVNKKWGSEKNTLSIYFKLLSTMWLSHLTSGYILIELKLESQRDICSPMFTAILLTITKLWKLSKYLSMDEWIEKVWYYT